MRPLDAGQYEDLPGSRQKACGRAWVPRHRGASRPLTKATPGVLPSTKEKVSAPQNRYFRCSIALPVRTATDTSPDPSRGHTHGSRRVVAGYTFNTEDFHLLPSASSPGEPPFLRRHYPASSVLRAHPPPRRPGLTLAGCRLARATPPTGLPVLQRFPSSTHASTTTPAETARCMRCFSSRAAVGLPLISGGSAPASKRFRGLLGVHSRSGLHGR